jgi:hypothetical protein
VSAPGWTKAALDAHVAKLGPAAGAQWLGLVAQLPPVFTDPAFPEQQEFIDDPARFKILFGTRRSGKSYTCGRLLFKTAVERPKSNCLYIGLSREEAKRIIWKDVLVPLNEDLALGATPNHSDLSWSFPNGSKVYLIGLDSEENEKRKVYGQKFACVIIDEAALYRIDLEELIHSVLLPALADMQGTLVLAGMPSNYQRGLFYKLTEGQEASKPGTWNAFDGRVHWKGFRWSAFENPHMRKVWEQEVAGARASNPAIDEDPKFQQDYLGRWSVDSTKKVYRYKAGHNDYSVLPASSDWYTILGIDPGYVDQSAFVVARYRPHDPTLYILRAEKRAGMDVLDVAKHIQSLQDEFDFDRMVVDGANLQAVETIRRRFGIPLQAAEKLGKWEHIQIMNSDFLAGRIKLGPETKPLIDEYSKLIRDEQSDKPRAKPGLAEDCCDAALYVWRHAYHYIEKPKPPVPVVGSPEWARMEEARMWAAAEAAAIQGDDPWGDQ